MAGFKEETLKELLKGYEKPKIFWVKGGHSQGAEEGAGRARAWDRADRTLGLREGRTARSRPRAIPATATARGPSMTRAGRSSWRFLGIATGVSSRS